MYRTPLKRLQDISSLRSNLFSYKPKQNVASYNSEAGPIFDQAFIADTTSSTYALVRLLREATDLGHDSYSQQLHTHILKSGLLSESSVSTALLRFYRLEESMINAHKLFDEITQPTVVAWNSLISGYVKSGKFRKALTLFSRLNNGGGVDGYSYSSALAACGQLSLLKVGESIHCNVMKSGFEVGVVVANCLIDMYGKCGFVEEAIQVFCDMIDKDIVSWNSVVAACGRNGRLESAYSFFSCMPERDTISYNELINGIAQYGNVEDAIMVLFSMENPNSSSWNSIITGYVNRNQPRKALDFFAKMHTSGVQMDTYTYSILLSGVAAIAALQWGMTIHCCTIKHDMDTSVVVGSSLVDMYSKCGHLKSAELIFESLQERNLITWNTMISGYANNGDSCKVIELFEEMKTGMNLKPDRVTFLNVIAMCSNSEVPLQTAIQYFESMIKEYEIEPKVEHCCSIIRLMGQKGDLRLATRIIYELGFGNCGVVWQALLGACGTCKDLKVALRAAAKVIELEGDNDYLFVMLSNVLAHYGKWESVRKVREVMKERGVRKEVGRSWTEIGCS